MQMQLICLLRATISIQHFACSNKAIAVTIQAIEIQNASNDEWGKENDGPFLIFARATAVPTGPRKAYSTADGVVTRSVCRRSEHLSLVLER